MRPLRRRTIALCACGVLLLSCSALRPTPAIADSLPLAEKISTELDTFRHAASAGAGGNPVTYGDGECYALVKQYIEDLGYDWVNHDPSPNTYDLYDHFDSNGLAGYFERIPASGGASPPQIGDIVVYGAGDYVGHNGHAGVVSAVNGDGSYMAIEQNFNQQRFVTDDWRDFNPGWNTLGYLRPKL